MQHWDRAPAILQVDILNGTATATTGALFTETVVRIK